MDIVHAPVATEQVPRRSSMQIVTPTPIDVLCGTGLEKHHTGNDLFKRIVSQFLQPYANAQTKKDKMEITKTILYLLTQWGIRFLKKEIETDSWYLADSKVARDKVGHFLRLHVPKNFEHQHPKAAEPPILNTPCSSLPCCLIKQKEGYQLSNGGAMTYQTRITPLSHFLGGVHDTVTSSSAGVGIHTNTLVLDALEQNDKISTIWNTIMDDTTINQSKSAGGGYDYSRSLSEHRSLLQHQPAPSLSYQGLPVLQHQRSSASASSASTTSSFSKRKSEALFSTKVPSSVLSKAAHYIQKQDGVMKKEAAAIPLSLFQKTEVEDASDEFRQPNDSSTITASALFNKSHNEDTSFEDSLPTLHIWNGSAVLPALISTPPNADAWSRLSWSSCGTIGNKSADMTDSATSMEDIFDESDLASMCLDN